MGIDAVSIGMNVTYVQLITDFRVPSLVCIPAVVTNVNDGSVDLMISDHSIFKGIAGPRYAVKMDINRLANTWHIDD